MENVLTYMTFIPVAGMVVVLLLPSKSPNLIRWVSAAFTVPPLLMACWLYANFDPAKPGLQFVERAPWIPCLQHSVFGRCRWPQHLHGAAYRSVVLSLHFCFLGHRQRSQGILRAFPIVGCGHDGCLRGPRFFPLFYLLGSDASAHVLSHRSLGRAAAGVCRHQVFFFTPFLAAA